MTQENKELLLKDLSARLPYGVKGVRPYTDKIATLHFIIPKCKIPNDGSTFIELEFDDLDCCPIDEFKPYLRPMSSMTEEERVEMGKAIQEDRIEPWGEIKSSGVDNLLLCSCRQATNFMDWLNAHHFDYRGLIEKGLAIEATEDIY